MSDKSTIIKEAKKYIARGQIDKAIAEWEKLVKDFPDAPTYNTLGDLYLKSGNKTNAVSSFHKAANLFRHEGFSLKALALYKKILNIKPADADSLLSLGELNEEKGLTTDAIKYYLATADSLSKEGKKDKLLVIYEKILKLSPSNVPLRTKVAEIYAKEGLSSESSQQYFQLAKLFSEKDEIEKAMEYYKKALDIEPLLKEAILGMNDLYERTGKLDMAAEQMKEACSLFPDDTDIHLRGAQLCITTNNFDEAKNHLIKVTEAEPMNVKARTLLGDLYIQMGEKEKAWTEYLPVLDEMIVNERYDDAMQLLESFKDIDPIETGKRLVSLYRQLDEQSQVANELIALGNVFSAQDMRKEALECYKEAFEITPDDVTLKAKIDDIDKEISDDYVAAASEKTLDEAIVEADIFLRYGLHENAKNLLEPYKNSDPENIDLHMRLKSLYAELKDKEQAITECLTLYNLYQQAGDSIQSEQILKEAQEINPEDERLIDIAPAAVQEEPTEAPVSPPEGPPAEDYSEELIEADFYTQQGLINEARKLLTKLHDQFPEDIEISQKLSSLDEIPEKEAPSELVDETQQEQLAPEGEILEAEDFQEIALDSDVLDIFTEFKKGLEKELEEEDHETHYNLGIAYKEMGLLDDAIREFQTARKNQKRFVASSNMLGICYVEKGLYSLAIEVLKSALDKMEDRNESYWAMKYDIAEAYEKNGNLKEAYDLYTEVYGWNAKFRSVSDKIDYLKAKVAEPDVEKQKPKERKDRVSYL
jgi:tetratricopeptide (TPR) repeat protein